MEKDNGFEMILENDKQKNGVMESSDIQYEECDSLIQNLKTHLDHQEKNTVKEEILNMDVSMSSGDCKKRKEKKGMKLVGGNKSAFKESKQNNGLLKSSSVLAGDVAEDNIKPIINMFNGLRR